MLVLENTIIKMGKRNLDVSIFAAIEELDSEDRRGERKRRKETNAEKHKAVEAQTQTKIYNHLVESRILLQRAINNANVNLDQDKKQDIVNNGGKPTGKREDEHVTSFRGTCNSLLEKLLRARNQISDNEMDPNKYGSILSSSASTNLHDSLQCEYEEQKKDWIQILNRRHKSLVLHSGVTAKSQFRVMNSTFWEQVEATIEYEDIREKNASQSMSNGCKNLLFDDSKVYQQLLRDFVANSTSNGAGALSSSDKIRSSMKRKNSNSNNNNKEKKDIDRRASKGRKIRFKEISKLVGFTFPLSRPNLSNLDQDEYFQSLFGGAGASQNNN